MISQNLCYMLVVRESIWQRSILLSSSWRWRTMLDCEMASRPNALQVILAGFASVAFVKLMKMTICNGLGDVQLTECPPSVIHWIRLSGFCQAHEDDELQWTVRCPADRMPSECYSLDSPQWILSSSWRWRIAMDCDVSSWPNALRVLFTGFASVDFVKLMKMTNCNGLWDVQLTECPLSVTHRIYLNGLELGLWINSFRPI